MRVLASVFVVAALCICATHGRGRQGGPLKQPATKPDKLIPIGVLPSSSCDFKQGVLCYPSACEKYSCGVTQNTICIADRCGCEARIFKKQADIWKEVTNICRIYNQVRHYNFTEPNPKSPKSTLPPTVQVEIFRDFTHLLSELLVDLAKYLQEKAKQSPTKVTLKRLREVLRGFRALKRAHIEADTAARDFTQADDAESVDHKFEHWKQVALDIVKGLNQTLNDSDTFPAGSVLANDQGILPFITMLSSGVQRGVTGLFSLGLNTLYGGYGTTAFGNLGGARFISNPLWSPNILPSLDVARHQQAIASEFAGPSHPTDQWQQLAYGHFNHQQPGQQQTASQPQTQPANNNQQPQQPIIGNSVQPQQQPANNQQQQIANQQQAAANSNSQVAPPSIILQPQQPLTMGTSGDEDVDD